MINQAEGVCFNGGEGTKAWRTNVGWGRRASLLQV